MSEPITSRGSNAAYVGIAGLHGQASSNGRLPGIRSPLVYVQDGQEVRRSYSQDFNGPRTSPGGQMRPELLGSILLACLMVGIELRIWRRELKARRIK